MVRTLLWESWLTPTVARAYKSTSDTDTAPTLIRVNRRVQSWSGELAPDPRTNRRTASSLLRDCPTITQAARQHPPTAAHDRKVRDMRLL